MALTQLNARVAQELAAPVRAAAQHGRRAVQDYAADVLAADQAAAEGPEEPRRASASMHAAVADERWLASGQSEAGATSCGAAP
ncbi:hypothetical protein ACGFT2_14850 [Streptomyces sp. NPDC048514]|uniref:hypothetical protein n=1 Tax=Streptomyces sp. NPDC048514 TaxID=3365564 RepID=UPI003723EEE4